AVFQHGRGHGESHVGDEQFDQGVQVGAFQGVGEAGDELVFGGGVGLACRPAAAGTAGVSAAGVGAAGVGEVTVDGGASAFEGAANGFLGGVEHLSDFGRVVA